MKKIIAFLITVYSWFLSLFKKKEEKKILKEMALTNPYKGKTLFATSNPQTPGHNNRKVKRGRFVQYINTGDGRKRAIYHSSK